LVDSDSYYFSLLDTGSTVTLADADLFKHLAWKTDIPMCVVSASNHAIESVGYVELTLDFNGLHMRHRVFLIKDFQHQVLIGLDLLSRFNCIQFDFFSGILTLNCNSDRDFKRFHNIATK